jgi:hypothetical protein
MLLQLSNLALWGGFFVVGLFSAKQAVNRSDPSYQPRVEEAKARLAEQAREGPVQPDDAPWAVEPQAEAEQSEECKKVA